MEDRPNSLLTNAQREYLHGEKDYSPSTERKTRERIRDRTAAGIADLKLLSETLDSDDWDQIFEEFSEYAEFQERRSERDDDETPPSRTMMPGYIVEEGQMMTRALHGTAEFLYIALHEYGGGLDSVENVLETAIENVETTRSERAHVDVDLCINREPRPVELLERIEEGETLNKGEIETLIEAGETEVISSFLLESWLGESGMDEE